MIAAVNLAVAVSAISGDNEAIECPVCQIAVVQEAADMRASTAADHGRVTLLAQLRPGFVQQRRMIGAMYTVTKGAVFGDRLVFPQERSAFFGMAAVAVFINRELIQCCRPCRPMRIVAIAADNLVFPDRMSGYAECLCPNVLVAGVAHFGLGGALGHIMALVY